MEAAALGKPIVTGPHMENFDSPMTLLSAAGALRRVETSRDLPTVIGELLADEPTRKRLGAAAREVVLRNQGATNRTADRLVQWMPAAGPTR